MENVAWIVSGEYPENLASYRYNAIIPARELSGKVVRFDPADDPNRFLAENKVDGIVVCKPLRPEHGSSGTHPFVELTRLAKKRGVKVCFHICDWHFDNPDYKQLAEICDLVVVQTKWIAAAVGAHFGRTPAIIEEPFEGPRGKARFKPGRVAKLVWYGHSYNLDTLIEGFGQLTRLRSVFKLNVVTNDVRLAKKWLDALPRPEFMIERKISKFNLEAQWRAIDSADAVLIPSMPTDVKMVKGHNRLVQSIHAGRLAVAFPLPPYKELEDYCVCSEDLAEGLTWALENQPAVFRKLKAGQKYIDSRFAPGVVAGRWKDELTRMLDGSG